MGPPPFGIGFVEWVLMLTPIIEANTDMDAMVDLAKAVAKETGSEHPSMWGGDVGNLSLTHDVSRFRSSSEDC